MASSARFHLLGILGIVALDGGHQLLHQHVIDLFRFHALERQVKVLHDDVHAVPIQRLPLRQDVPQRFDVLEAQWVLGVWGREWCIGLADYPFPKYGL